MQFFYMRFTYNIHFIIFVNLHMHTCSTDDLHPPLKPRGNPALVRGSGETGAQSDNACATNLRCLGANPHKAVGCRPHADRCLPAGAEQGRWQCGISISA